MHKRQDWAGDIKYARTLPISAREPFRCRVMVEVRFPKQTPAGDTSHFAIHSGSKLNSVRTYGIRGCNPSNRRRNGSVGALRVSGLWSQRRG